MNTNRIKNCSFATLIKFFLLISGLSFNNFVLYADTIITKSPERELKPSIDLSKLDNVSTAGSIAIHGKEFRFSANDQGNQSYKLVFGITGRQITLIPDLKNYVLKVSSDKMVLSREDTKSFESASLIIEQKLGSVHAELQHNKLLIGMLRYYALAPPGYEVITRTEAL